MTHMLFVLAAAVAAATAPTPAEILEQSPADAWRDVAPGDLLLMDVGDRHRVAIELAPRFAPAHVGNIRALAGAGWFDRTAIVRVQENYVAQWGDASGAVAFPLGFERSVKVDYSLGGLPPAFDALPFADSYAPATGYSGGWPVATDGRAHWPVHCHSMVGAGRENPPDVGNGAELYAVIGHAPRHLDRNIALVGRVIDGMQHLSALPRGTGDLGFYKTRAERARIGGSRLASDLPPAERPRYQVLRTDSPTFDAWVQARANRRDRFFVQPAGGIDICNAMPPIRRIAD